MSATTQVRRILTVALIVLVIAKLTGAPGLSWWVVTAPLWGPAALAALYLLGGGAALLALKLLDRDT